MKTMVAYNICLPAYIMGIKEDDGCKVIGICDALRKLEAATFTKSHPGDKWQDLDLNAMGLTAPNLAFSNKLTTSSLAL